jgi:RNA polymerase sigma factor (sigma-70 family)
MATAPPRPDTWLLERLRQRDRTAWDEIYRLYEGRLYGFAYRLTGNPHDAADLVQETFVRALPKLDRLPPERADIAAYLFATTKNLFLKSVERSKRQQPVEEVPEPDEPAAIEDDPQRSALLRHQQEEVRIANAKLAPRQRLVLALRELEDRSYAEIGELVGLNENAVAQLISRARQSLREELRLVQVDRSKLPKECQELLPLLSAHLDGQLRGPKLDKTLAHLEGCSDCQTVLADMREASRRYRAVVPPLVGLAALKDRIDDALAANGYWHAPATGWKLGAWAAGRSKLFLVTAGAVGAVAIGGLGGGLAYVATHSGGGSTPPPAAAGSSVAETSSAGSTAGEAAAALADASGDATSGAGATGKAKTAGGSTGGTTAGDTAASTEAGTDTSATTATTATTAGETGPGTSTTTGGSTDRTPPVVSILSGPSDPTVARSAVFRVRANEKAELRCRLDGGPSVACSSPVRFDDLGPGEHVFTVRAVDAAGNLGPSISYGWTILDDTVTTPPPPSTTAPTTTETQPPADTSAPSVSITSAPPKTTTETSASFQFTASEPASFRCQLDGGGFSSCQSPVSYSRLGIGSHTFTVQAVDGAGNTGSVSYTWRIEAPALPDLVVSELTAGSVTVTNVGDGAAGSFVVQVTGGGSFTIPGLAPGASATRTWSGNACAEGTITATVDPAGQVEESNEGNNSRSTTVLC